MTNPIEERAQQDTARLQAEAQEHVNRVASDRLWKEKDKAEADYTAAESRHRALTVEIRQANHWLAKAETQVAGHRKAIAEKQAELDSLNFVPRAVAAPPKEDEAVTAEREKNAALAKVQAAESLARYEGRDNTSEYNPVKHLSEVRCPICGGWIKEGNSYHSIGNDELCIIDVDRAKWSGVSQSRIDAALQRQAIAKHNAAEMAEAPARTTVIDASWRGV